MQEFTKPPQGILPSLRSTLLVLLMVCAGVGTVFGQDQAPQKLSLDQAIQSALANSADLEAAQADVRASEARALAAKFKFIPGISASGSYTVLSELPPSTLTLPGGFSFDFPSAKSQAASFGLKLQYPVFTGFRLLEAAKIAELQTTSKELGMELVQRALRFEVSRAYWECLRATANVNMLVSNRDVVLQFQQEIRSQVDLGLATSSDQLAADQRLSAAEISLNDATVMRNQAFVGLAMIVGRDDLAQALVSDSMTGKSPDKLSLPFDLDTSIEDALAAIKGPETDLAKGIEEALAKRPESKLSQLGVDISEHAANAAAGGLFPSLTVFGDYTYANPNQRVFPPKDEFTGTWSLGAQVSIDIGGIAGTLAQMQAAQEDSAKAKAQSRKQRDQISLDLRSTTLTLNRNIADLNLSSTLVQQGNENLRVSSQKYDVGLVKRNDLLDAQLALLRAQFALTNKQLDVVISWADYQRASGQ